MTATIHHGDCLDAEEPITREDLARAWAEGYNAGGEDHSAYLRALNGLQDDAARTPNPHEVNA